MRFLYFTLVVISSSLFAEPWASMMTSPTIQSFQVLDESGREGPAKVPMTGNSPFGVLLTLSGNGEMFFCTATHIQKGVGVTAAHCVQSPSAPHFIIFYDKAGKKIISPVPEFSFVGDIIFDIATFKIPADAAENWDVAGVDVFTPTPSNGSEGPAHGVTIWSYSPTGNGMQFTPNRCTGATSKPYLEAWTPKGDPSKPSKLLGKLEFIKEMVEADHVFLDKCDREIVKGNSGSLITLSNNFRAKIGIAHCIIAEKDKVWEQMKEKKIPLDGVEIYYRTVDQRLEPVMWNLGEFMVGTGSLFESLQKRAPAALQ